MDMEMDVYLCVTICLFYDQYWTIQFVLCLYTCIFVHIRTQTSVFLKMTVPF